jgi:hypothetical protein
VISWLQAFAFKWFNSYRYRMVNIQELVKQESEREITREQFNILGREAVKVGAVQVAIQSTHSLKPPGFVSSWFITPCV